MFRIRKQNCSHDIHKRIEILSPKHEERKQEYIDMAKSQWKHWKSNFTEV